VPPPETQIVNAPSGLEEGCEAMKGNRPDAIPQQIYGSAVTNIDVIGSKEVRAKVAGEHRCNHETGNSEMSLVAHDM
jgi:hypothetical protein